MHADFLAAICDEPDDLLHRLVYADWLEENGTTPLDAARSELIRVQIALESASPDGDEFWQLRARERVLIQTWRKGLAGPLRHLVKDYRFRRGFVEWVKVDAGILERHGEKLMRLAPLQGVSPVGSLSRWIPQLMRRFREVDLRGAINHGIGGPLTAFLDPERLTTLRASGHWDAEVESLLAAGLPALRELEFTADWRGGRRQSLWQALRASDLQPERMTLPVVGPPRDLQALLGGLTWLESVSSLCLQNLPMGLMMPFVQSLNGGAILPRLRHLRLFATGERRASSVQPRAAHLPHLETLELNVRNPVAASVGVHLCALEIPELRRLRLDGLWINEDDLGQIFRYPRWSKLHTLEVLATESLGDREFEALTQGPHLPRLRRLELGRPAQAADVRRLVHGRRPLSGGQEQTVGHGPERLAELIFNRVEATTRLDDFTTSPYLGRLTTLCLPGIGAAGLRGLARDELPRLTWLDACGEALPPATRAALVARLGSGLRFGATWSRGVPF